MLIATDQEVGVATIVLVKKEGPRGQSSFFTRTGAKTFDEIRSHDLVLRKLYEGFPERKNGRY